MEQDHVDEPILTDSNQTAQHGSQDTVESEFSTGQDHSADESDASAGSNDNLPDTISLLQMAAMHVSTESLFRALLPILHMHAWRSLGLVADQSGQTSLDLGFAQLAIDCYASILGKTEGSLPDTERRDLQRLLMDMRMNYLSKRKDASVA